MIETTAAEEGGVSLNRPIEPAPMLSADLIGEPLMVTEAGAAEMALPPANRANRSAPPPSSGRTAIIPLIGPLFPGDYALAQVRLMKAVNDPNVSQIMLYVDSPGGTVAGAFEAADQVAAACTVQPVVAVVGGMACSAAYLLASAADEIIISETSIVGSIGVIAMHVDQSEALARNGVKVTEVIAGQKKADLSPFRPLSDPAKADVQARIDQVHELFIGRVATWRGISPNAVRNTEAGVFMGAAAVSKELADRIGSAADLLPPVSETYSMEGQGMPRQMLSYGIPLVEARPKTKDDPTRHRSFLMEEALVARLTGREPPEYARRYAKMTAVDLAASLLEPYGIGGDTGTVVTAAFGHTAGDFPNLLRNVGNRILSEMYDAAPSPLRQTARLRPGARDYRPMSRLRLGGYSGLLEVDDGEEVKQGTLAESVSSFAIAQYARSWTWGRKAMINDDLSGLFDFSGAMAHLAVDCEANELVKLLSANNWHGPTMDDGKPLFDPAHGNLRSEGALLPAADFFDEGRQAMRRQKGIGGSAFINVSPKWVVTSEARETEMEKALTAITPARSDDANPFASKLSLGVEPRLPAKRSYLFADPAYSPVLEYAYLEGSRGPEIIQTTNEGGFLGVTFTVVHDFGCGVADWRGAFMDEKTEGGGNA